MQTKLKQTVKTGDVPFARPTRWNDPINDSENHKDLDFIRWTGDRWQHIMTIGGGESGHRFEETNIYPYELWSDIDRLYPTPAFGEYIPPTGVPDDIRSRVIRCSWHVLSSDREMQTDDFWGTLADEYDIYPFHLR